MLETVPSLAELASAAKSSAPKTVSAAAISVSSLSTSSAVAPDGSSLSLEDDELLKSSYTKIESIRMLFLLKNKVLWLNTYRYLNWNMSNRVSSLLRLPQNRNYVNTMGKMHQLTNKEARTEDTYSFIKINNATS